VVVVFSAFFVYRMHKPSPLNRCGEVTSYGCASWQVYSSQLLLLLLLLLLRRF
jgi:hypothetical protein